MKKSVRKAVVAGNWKMNKTRPEAKALLDELKPLVSDIKSVEVVACVPFTNLETALEATKGTNIKVGGDAVNEASPLCVWYAPARPQKGAVAGLSVPDARDHARGLCPQTQTR